MHKKSDYMEIRFWAVIFFKIKKQELLQYKQRLLFFMMTLINQINYKFQNLFKKHSLTQTKKQYKILLKKIIIF